MGRWRGNERKVGEEEWAEIGRFSSAPRQSLPPCNGGNVLKGKAESGKRCQILHRLFPFGAKRGGGFRGCVQLCLSIMMCYCFVSVVFPFLARAGAIIVWILGAGKDWVELRCQPHRTG